MNTSEYIAYYLTQCGVDKAFVISGSGAVYLDDAFYHHSELECVAARSDFGAVMMACATARLTGKIGAALVTKGPASIHAMTGVSEAWADSVPLVVVSGQVDRDQIQSNTRTIGAQGFDIVPMVSHITKYAVTVSNPNEIKYHLEKAVHLATTGRPGPVWLDIPIDIQNSEVDIASLIEYQCANDESLHATNISSQVAALLEQATRPVLILGNGVRHADSVPYFYQLVERLNIPVVVTRLALDLFDHSDPRFIGYAGDIGHKAGNEALKNADLVLSLGSSLAPTLTGTGEQYSFKNAKVVSVNIEHESVYRNDLSIDYVFDIDLRDFLPSLLAHLSRASIGQYKDWLTKCQSMKEQLHFSVSQDDSKPIDMYYFMSKLNPFLNDRHVIINDTGGTYTIAGQVIQYVPGQREICTSTFASMGAALSLGAGSAIADRDKQIIVLVGDGSVESNIQELAVIAKHNTNTKIFIFNNGRYASIRHFQNQLCDGRITDSDDSMNFSKIAGAFSLNYYAISSADEIEDIAAQVLTDNDPMVIEVFCEPNQHFVLAR